MHVMGKIWKSHLEITETKQIYKVVWEKEIGTQIV